MSIDGFRTRSIPACAGEPYTAALFRQRVEVYPRVCGGTTSAVRGQHRRRGLSPRVRGNHRDLGKRSRAVGSIPACAGEPVAADMLPLVATVYPRVCGGTVPSVTAPTQEPGLSPRVRGTTVVVKRQHSRRGLSPRVRGNLFTKSSSRTNPRSIPACAGEPSARPCLVIPEWVYPRVCGEPTSSIPGLSRSRVYPRVCGGTRHVILGWPEKRGLSPRVRGNLAMSAVRVV